MLSTPAWLRDHRLYRRLRALEPIRQLIQAKHRRAGRASLEIGPHFWGPEPRILVYPGDNARAVVGSFGQFAGNVVFILGGNHRADWVSAYHMRLQLDLEDATSADRATSRGDILAGNDVWIGRGAMVLSGVRIGDGAVVGAGAVVTRDVRPYAIVAGNPAREIRRRFSDEEIEALQRIAWWDWPIEQIIERVARINNVDIAGFIRDFDPARAPSRTHGSPTA